MTIKENQLLIDISVSTDCFTYQSKKIRKLKIKSLGEKLQSVAP